jgi:hypothetical protein
MREHNAYDCNEAEEKSTHCHDGMKYSDPSPAAIVQGRLHRQDAVIGK